MVKAWQAYNRLLAENNKLSAHGKPTGVPNETRKSFFRNNKMEEAAASLADGISSPFVVCGPIIGKPTGIAPGMRKWIRTRMYFLAHFTQGANLLEDIQQQTWELMMQFVAKYLHDYENAGTCGPFQKLDPKKMIWQEVGPLLQNEYGWQLDLEFLEDGSELMYEPTKWY